MTIRIKPEQLKWLDEQVASGTFPSVEDAVEAAIGDLMALADDDLAWAGPLVEEARAAIARGEGLKAADVKAETEALLRSRGG